MPGPLVSIILPVHNAVAFLEETLRSVALQSDIRWECLIVNDHSSDGSHFIYNRFMDRDKRFKVFECDKNGANAARNLGISKSSSSHLIFLDADDLLEKNCVSDRMKVVHKHPSYDMYIFKTAISDGRQITGCFSAQSELPWRLLLAFIRHEIPWHTTSPVWNKRFIKKIGEWNDDYPRLQDVELNVRALLRGARMKFDTGSPDSVYLKRDLTVSKIENVLHSSCKLIDDYYTQMLIDADQHGENEVLESFGVLIEKTIGLYINRAEHPMVSWEKKFLDTLRMIGAERTEIDYVITIFKIFKKTATLS